MLLSAILLCRLFLESKEIENINVDTDGGQRVDMYQNKGFKWMRDTALKNTLLMNAQERNIHGKIFGGYLMKTAYELAWALAVTYFGVYTPVFVAVDDIQFVKVSELRLC